MLRWIKAVVPLAAVAALAVWFLFRDSWPYLQQYEGRVVRAYRDETNNISTGSVNLRLFLVVDTAEGQREYEVPAHVFSQVRVGSTVRKKAFSSRYSVTR